MGHGFAIKKPVKDWNKPIQVNYKDLFVKLGKVAVQGGLGVATMNPAVLVGAIKEALGAFMVFKEVPLCEWLKDPGQVAWVLIHRALVLAVARLVHEEEARFEEPERPEELAERIGQALEAIDAEIDEIFFLHPKRLAFLEAFQEQFALWLQGYGLDEAQARSISGRLPSYFPTALHEAWRDRPPDYICLKEAINTPFTRASQREQSWQQYRAWLQHQVAQPVFEEGFSLEQIYVKPRAYYEEESKDKRRVRAGAYGLSPEERKAPKRIVVDLMAYLDEWVTAADRDDAIRLLSGDPGSGKSSFAKMFAAHRAESDELWQDAPVFFVELHHLDMEDDLVAALEHYIEEGPFEDGWLAHNPLGKEGDHRLLLILDGLDELSMRGKLGENTAQEFVREVQKKVERFNLHEIKLQVLITGRVLAVQAGVREVQRRGLQQVVHVLPYFIPERKRELYEDPAALIIEDQRQKWWKQYGMLKGKPYEAMPDELARDDLDEITAQPILNYLVALTDPNEKN